MADSSNDAIYKKATGPFLYDVTGKRFFLVFNGFVVGRTAGNLVYSNDIMLSRQHCRFYIGESATGTASVEDLRSKNGTVVDGKKLTPGKQVPLKDGSLVEVGTQLLFFTHTQEVPAVTAERSATQGPYLPPTYSAEVTAPTQSSPAPVGQGASVPRSEDSKATRALGRAARVRLLPLHGILFKRTSPPDSGDIQIADISSAGIGFLRTSAASGWPNVGTIVSGHLSVAGKPQVLINAKIVRVTPFVVGCTFEGDISKLRKFIEDYFSVEFAATTVKDVTESTPIPPGQSEVRRFVGSNQCELYFTQLAGNVTGWYVVVFGNRVDGDDRGKFRFTRPGMGKSVDASATGVPDDIIRLAIRFVESIEGLDEEIRNSLASSLRKHTAS